MIIPSSLSSAFVRMTLFASAILYAKAQGTSPVEIQRWNGLGEISYAIHSSGEYVAYGPIAHALRGDEEADGTLRILRVSDGEAVSELAFELPIQVGPGSVPPLHMKPGFRTPAFSPDGNWLAVEGAYGNYSLYGYLFSLNPDEEPRLKAPIRFSPHEQRRFRSLERLLFSRDARSLYWAYRDDGLAGSFDRFAVEYSLPNAEILNIYELGAAHVNESPSLDLANDPPFALTHNNHYSEIGPQREGAYFQIVPMQYALNGIPQWENDGEPIVYPITGDNYYNVSLSPNGTGMVATDFVGEDRLLHKHLYYWPVPFDDPSRPGRIWASQYEVQGYAWHPNNRILAIVDDPDPDLDSIDFRFVDVLTSESLGLFENLAGSVGSLQFSQNGTSIGMIADGKDLVLIEIPEFSLKTVMTIQRIEPENDVLRAHISGNSQSDFIVQSSGDLETWKNQVSGTIDGEGNAYVALPMESSAFERFFKVVSAD